MAAILLIKIPKHQKRSVKNISYIFSSIVVPVFFSILGGTAVKIYQKVLRNHQKRQNANLDPMAQTSARFELETLLKKRNKNRGNFQNFQK